MQPTGIAVQQELMRHRYQAHSARLGAVITEAQAHTKVVGLAQTKTTDIFSHVLPYERQQSAKMA